MLKLNNNFLYYCFLSFFLLLLFNCKQPDNEFNDKPARINVYPSLATIEKGKTQIFSVEVINGNNNVIWSIRGIGNDSLTNINENGELFVAYNEDSSSIEVIATSEKYSDIYGSAVVNILPYVSKAVISQDNVIIAGSIPDFIGQDSIDVNNNISISLINSITSINFISEDVSSWFNIPILGLQYIANFNENSSIIEIQILGSPLNISKEEVIITIPNNILRNHENNNINTPIIIEGNIRYNIIKGIILDNLISLENYLNTKEINTPDTPYYITLINITSVSDLYTTIYTSVGNIETGYGYRYVSLDLSEISIRLV